MRVLLKNALRPFLLGLVSIIVMLSDGVLLPILAAQPNLSYYVPLDDSAHRPPALKAKRKSSKAPATPVVIQDIRVTPYPDHTRLVLDLQRAISFAQHRQKTSNRIVIELQNVLLSKAAKAKLSEGQLPQDITIAQSNRTGPQSMMISLNLDSIGDYKLLPLNHPYRLVIDVYNKILPEEIQPTTAAEPPPPPAIVTRPPAATRRPMQREVKTIVIDAGHGGKDPGAVGRGGTAEKDITLKVSLLLRDLLTKQLGTQVVMTRDRDVFVELEDRAKFANREDADLFVSIHVNAHPQRGTKGLEVYHFGEASDPRALAVAARENGTPIETTGVGWQYLVADLLTTKKMEESQDLAWSTHQALVGHLNTHYEVIDHGVKTGPFYVLRFTSMPSILAEIAFISNPTEERLMKTTPFLTRIAEGIFEGIKTFIHPLQRASR
jgi:N-acetylmuramoyl-L-alanine amidase